MTLGNPDPFWGQAQKCGRIKPENGIATLPHLIIGSPRTMQI